jgi:hypothetical protein
MMFFYNYFSAPAKVRTVSGRQRERLVAMPERSLWISEDSKNTAAAARQLQWIRFRRTLPSRDQYS